MSIGEDMRQWLQETASVRELTTRDRIHQTQPPETYQGAYLFFARAGIEREEVIDEPQGDQPFRQRFDVEPISEDPREAAGLADAILGLHAYRGDFGGGTVQAVFVRDQTDDYEPKGLASDVALHFSAFDVEIVGYQP